MNDNPVDQNAKCCINRKNDVHVQLETKKISQSAA